MFYFYCLLLCSPFSLIIAARSWAQDNHSLHVVNIVSKPGYNEKIHAQEHCETSDYQSEHTERPPHTALRQPLRHSLEARADQEPSEILQHLTTNQLVARNKEISDLAIKYKQSRNGKALIEIVTRLVTTESIHIQNCVVIALGPVGQLKASKEQLAAFEVLFDVIRSIPCPILEDALSLPLKTRNTGLEIIMYTSQTQNSMLLTRRSFDQEDTKFSRIKETYNDISP